MDEIRLPPSCLVVLVGVSASGKSTWAQAQFDEGRVVSSDRLRAATGASEADQQASGDAFTVLDAIVAARLRRHLFTVVDTTGLDAVRRAAYVDAAHDAGASCVAVVFDAPKDDIERRNAEARWPLPKRVLTSQRRGFAKAITTLPTEGFDAIHRPADVYIVPTSMVEAPAHRLRQREEPTPMKFGLQLSSFEWQGGPADLARQLTELAHTAESAGFSSLWVMDHFRQIPQVGPEWSLMPESYTTLAFLAGVTKRASIGALVTGVGFRNPAHLGKIVATLDVLSGGRAVCGLGIGWFEKEAQAYGWDFPSVTDRYRLLEDTLELLPLLWGPGSPEYRGRVIQVPEAMCYPRPLQEHIPILIGGSGENRTLRLVAEHADMCNLFGEAATVRRKLDVLRSHCETVGRSFADIEVTHLSQAYAATDRRTLDAYLDTHRSATRTAEQVAERIGAGTIDDQIGRYRTLADAGVQHAIVALPDASDLASLRRFGEVIAAFTR